MIAALLASLWFYIFPMLTGRAILGWWEKERSLWSIFLYFVIGGLVLYAGAFIIQVFGLFTPSSLSLILMLLTGVVIGANGILMLQNWKFYGDFLQKNKFQIIPFMILIGLTLLAFIIWHWNVPAPYTLNWDSFEHQTLVNLIREGNFAYKTSTISDTFQFDGYSTMFHWLLTFPQILFKPNPLHFWWMIQGVHLFLSILAVYVLAFTVLKNRFLSLVAATIGALSFESYAAYATLFLVPQTFTAVVFAFAVVYILHTLEIKQQIRHWWFVPFLFVFLLLNHYIVGGLAIGILVGCMLLYFLLKRSPRSYSFCLIIGPIATYLILSFVSKFIPLASINGGEALQYVYSLTKLTDFMQVFFGFSLIILLPLGVIQSFISRSRKVQIIAVTTLVILAVVVSGIPYALKFYVIGHYLASVLMAYGIWFFTKHLSSLFLKSLVLGIVTIWFSIHLILNAVYWKNDVYYGTISTHIGPEEIQAGEWLHQHYGGKNVLLVSDPATQYVLEAVSTVNSQGGAYMKKDTREIVGNILKEQDAQTMNASLYTITDRAVTKKPDTILLVLSARFFRWSESAQELQQDISFNIWAPTPLSAKQQITIEKLVAHNSWNVVYKNADMVIVEIARPNFFSYLK